MVNILVSQMPLVLSRFSTTICLTHVTVNSEIASFIKLTIQHFAHAVQQMEASGLSRGGTTITYVTMKEFHGECARTFCQEELLECENTKITFIFLKIL